MNTFAKWRADLGRTQAEAADLLGMTQQNISHFECGRAKPRVDTRRLITAIAQGQLPEPWPLTESARASR